MKVNLRESHTHPDIKILDIEGHIDSYTYAILHDELRTLLNIGTCKLVCNFSMVGYIGADGLEVLFETIKVARQRGGDIKLCCLSNQIKSQFEAIGLGDVCSFYEDLNEAIRAFGELAVEDQDLAFSEEDMHKTTHVAQRSVMVPQDDTDIRAATVVMSKSPQTIIDTSSQTPAKPPIARESLALPQSVVAKTNSSSKAARSETQVLTREQILGDETAQPAVRPATGDQQTQITADLERTISMRLADMRQYEAQRQPAGKVKCFAYPVTYYLHQKIAEGNLGKVYQGEARSAYGFSRPVIFKYIKNDYAHDKETMGLLMREIRKISRIIHQNLAEIYDFVSWDDYYFVVMEYVNGISLETALAHLVQANHIFPPHVAVFLVYNLCIGLSYANRKVDDEGTALEIIHGEICPRNIMITKDGDIKLLGLATSKVNMMLQSTDKQGVLPNNLQYLAPEVLAAGMPTKCGDIFSLGVMLYEMLTGHKPFSGEEISHNRIGFPQAPSVFNRKVNDILEKIVLRCLLGEPERRFQDFQDLALQLEDLLQEKGFSLAQVSFAKFIENYLV